MSSELELQYILFQLLLYLNIVQIPYILNLINSVIFQMFQCQILHAKNVKKGMRKKKKTEPKKGLTQTRQGNRVMGPQ